jgi:two-component system response regulator FixJ
MKDTKKNGPIIYVVDDDDSMREALTLLLKTVGYSTASFSRPGDFLAK